MSKFSRPRRRRSAASKTCGCACTCGSGGSSDREFHDGPSQPIVVNVAAPIVHVSPPEVVVQVAPPGIYVPKNDPAAGKQITVQRDGNGFITGAKVEQ